MYGKITKFRDDIGFGIIVTEDGRKFRFARSEIMNPAAGLSGHGADFVVAGGRPTKIIVMAGSPWAAFGAAA